jgi:hypothetical protein
VLCTTEVLYFHSGGFEESVEHRLFPHKKFFPGLTGLRPNTVMNTSKIHPYFPGSMNKHVGLQPKQASTAPAIHMALKGSPMNSHCLRRLECLWELRAINRYRILCRPEAPYCLRTRMRHSEEFCNMSLTPSLPKIINSHGTLFSVCEDCLSCMLHNLNQI